LLPYGYRYRLSVKVKAFNAIYNGSGVQQYRFRRGIRALGSMDSGGVGIIGEAIPIPMGAHGVVVLSLADTEQRPAAFGDRWPIDAIAKNVFGPNFRLQTFIGLGPTRSISVRDLPLAVFFPHPSDPSSVRPLTPEIGIEIQAAELSITRAPITRGVIGQSLPWLDHYVREGRYLDGDTIQSIRSGQSFATSLSPRDFKSTTY
jgi:hypothetical protein